MTSFKQPPLVSRSCAREPRVIPSTGEGWSSVWHWLKRTWEQSHSGDVSQGVLATARGHTGDTATFLPCHHLSTG